MTARELVKGANSPLGTQTELQSLVLDVTWQAEGVECDLTVLVCDAERNILSDPFFVFFNQPEAPDRSVFLRSASDRSRGQVLVDFTALPRLAVRLVVALATVQEGRNLSGAKGVGVRAIDPRGPANLASYEIGGAITQEACLILTEIYRHGPDWKMRAVGQGYASGLDGLLRDFGVTVG